MEDKLVKELLVEFSKTNLPKYEKRFQGPNVNEVFVVKIERQKIANENRGFATNASTVSALPSGNPCGYCGGSGKV